MDMNDRKSETLTCTSSSRRRRRRRREDDVDEWRDWGSLHRDVLCIVLGKLTQTDILRGAGLMCSAWRRLAKKEPLLWRKIDLRDGGRWHWKKEQPPVGWKAMALAAMDRSAGRCESFAGHVDEDVLVHLANRAPLLRSLDVAYWPCIDDKKLITMIIMNLPLLERVVIRSGLFQEEMLVALMDHCPRLQLLNATHCWPTFRVWQEPIATRIRNSTIKHLMMPNMVLC